MAVRRYTRLTNALSKKIEHHGHAFALYTVWDNFVRMHRTLRMSPAMAAGVSTTLWSMDEIVGLVEQYEAIQITQKRGPYKKRISN
jgi:hypothetical protein